MHFQVYGHQICVKLYDGAYDFHVVPEGGVKMIYYDYSVKGVLTEYFGTDPLSAYSIRIKRQFKYRKEAIK